MTHSLEQLQQELYYLREGTERALAAIRRDIETMRTRLYEARQETLCLLEENVTRSKEEEGTY